MELVPVITARRRRLGLCVMTIVPALQLTTEYMGTGDRGRLLSKLTVSIIGLPLLIWGSSGGLRWAVGRRIGPLVLLIGGLLSAGTLYALLLCAMDLAAGSIAIFRPAAGVPPISTVLRVGFAMGLTYFGLWALAFVFPFALEDARLRALEAQQLRTAAELASLRSHLEPHFLLNTLSAISGLITEEPRAAQRLIGSLGSLLRDSLCEDRELQTLGEQIDWLRHYARIFEERHAGQLAFRWSVDSETRGALLPRLLLQPLVENAVKHGALGRKDGGWIEVRAQMVDAKRLVCTVEDNGLGMADGNARPEGFGLRCVRRRLALQYAERASLRLESSASGTRAIVEIPIDESLSSSAAGRIEPRAASTHEERSCQKFPVSPRELKMASASSTVLRFQEGSSRSRYQIQANSDACSNDSVPRLGSERYLHQVSTCSSDRKSNIVDHV